MQGNIEANGEEAVLDQFKSTDAVEVFARHLGFAAAEVHHGVKPLIPSAGA